MKCFSTVISMTFLSPRLADKLYFARMILNQASLSLLGTISAFGKNEESRGLASYDSISSKYRFRYTSHT